MKFALWLFTAFLLAACQTAAPPAPAEPAAAGPAPAQPAAKPAAEPAKPVAPETARNIANNCFTCHGPSGKSPGTIPGINRLSAEKLAGKLKDFKSGAEPSTVMGRHAKAYTDAEIEAVANYIASLNK